MQQLVTRTNASPQLAGAATLLVAAFGLGMGPTSSTPTIPAPSGPADYDVFDDMTQEELRTLQVKLTFVGPQQKPHPSVLVTEASQAPDISVFEALDLPGVNYFNDSVPFREFRATGGELEALLNNIGTLPDVTAGGVSADSYLSFTLYNSINGGVSFQAVLDPSDTSDLLEQAKGALEQNSDGLLELNLFGCSIGSVEAGQAQDVTAQVGVTLGGLRPQRDSFVIIDPDAEVRFVGLLTVVNNSGADIEGPVSIVFSLSPGANLADFSGATCTYAPAGRRFTNVIPAGQVLAAGQTLTVPTKISNPSLLPVQLSFQILVGPGAR